MQDLQCFAYSTVLVTTNVFIDKTIPQAPIVLIESQISIQVFTITRG